MDNILVDVLPTSIEIEGQEHEVNWNFRTCLRVILAFEDLELTMVEKCLVLLHNLYKERPDNDRLAIEKGVEFLDGGIERGSERGGMVGEQQLQRRLWG